MNNKSIRSRYPALDAATAISQAMPRQDGGLAASLFDLGASLSRIHQAEHAAQVASLCPVCQVFPIASDKVVCLPCLYSNGNPQLGPH